MINQFEVYGYLQDAFPVSSVQLTEDCRHNVYASVRAFFEFTANNIKQHKLKDVKNASLSPKGCT